MPNSIATSSVARRAVRTALAAVTACLALGVAAQAAQAAATITITQRTQPAGDPAAFSFHLTGPACPGNEGTDVTFELRDGQSQAIPLCGAQAFKVTQAAKAGWKLVDINCVATPPDPDPEDAFIIDIPSATATIELSPDEQKACTFVNEKLPAPTPTSAAPTSSGTAPAAVPAAPTPAAQGVSPVRVTRSAAALQAPRRCVSRRYTVSVRAGNVRSVTFSVNGRRVATVRARRGQRRFAVKLPPRAAVDRVVARVRFTERATPRTRTLRATIRRCAQAQARPTFTG